MKLIHALPAVGLIFSGLNFIPKTPQAGAVPASEPTVLPQMRLDKKECFKDESFELLFQTPHAGSLGVIDPDGKFFYLVFPEACTVGELKPLVSSEQFVALSRLRIAPASLKADPYIFGVDENRPVFTKSGTYRFILGDDLHVDDESMVSIVSIRYWNKKRPVSPEMLN